MKTKSKGKRICSQVTYWLGVVAVGLAVGLSIQFAVAWTEPTQAPPGGNLEAPINVSDNLQVKKGAVIFNSSGVNSKGLIANKGLIATNGDIIVNSGRVGIGTANPSSALNIKLDVKGDIVAGGGNSWDKRFQIGTALNNSQYDDIDNTTGPWLYYSDNVDLLSGWVGLRIGNEANAHFSVGKAKNTYAPVIASNYVTASDQRYKKDIKTIEGAIDRLKNTRGVDFKFKENNKQSMGIIAQEVEKDFPSLVSENEYGYKMVNYDGFVGVLVEAVKDQQEQIEKLQKEVESLK